MSTGFGKWYEEQKAEEETGGGWGDTLPLWSGEGMSLESLHWSNMKANMEPQMPKKIMGMGYQQRFQVRGETMS